MTDTLADIRVDVAEKVFYDFVPAGSMSELWDLDGLEKALKADFMIEVDLQKALRRKRSTYRGRSKKCSDFCYKL